MKTSRAILVAATCYHHSTIFSSAFSPSRPSLALPVHVKKHSTIILHNDSLDVDQVPEHSDFDENGPLGGNFNESPRSLGPKRTFLGVRRESGAMRRMLKQQESLFQQTGTGSTAVSSTSLASSPSALMPDGGLSPCVIKVLGVGGGGSNAVSCRSTFCLCQVL